MRERANHDARLLAGLLIAAGLLAGRCASLPGGVKLCATGEQLDVEAARCVCLPGHEPDADGRGCHAPEPPAKTTTTTTTTTSSTTTTTTTTSTLPPPRPQPQPTVPPHAPSPAPPQPAPPCPTIPDAAVDVLKPRHGLARRDFGQWAFYLAPSTCTDPEENSKCYPGRPSGADVPWPNVTRAPEGACSQLAGVTGTNVHFGNWAPVTLGGVALLCDWGYPNDDDSRARGCVDAFGRRFKWDGAWREAVLDDRWSGWWAGICPPAALTCTDAPPPAPPSSPGPGAPMPGACYAGPWRMHCRFESCEIKGEPGGSLYESVVAESVKRLGLVGQEVLEQDALSIARLIADDLRKAGYCVATHDDRANRLSDDEVGVWTPSNAQVENLDFCVASGATRGHCVVVARPFLVARGIK